MDLGDACHATLTGDFGHIVVARVGSGAAAVQCSPTGPVADLESRLQDFLAKHTPRAALTGASAGTSTGAAARNATSTADWKGQDRDA
jgi:hypothetical protein